jgi:hypothetical protein
MNNYMKAVKLEAIVKEHYEAFIEWCKEKQPHHFFDLHGVKCTPTTAIERLSYAYTLKKNKDFKQPEPIKEKATYKCSYKDLYIPAIEHPYEFIFQSKINN